MKSIKRGFLAITLIGSFTVLGVAQTQDMKNAGNSTKKAAKKTAHKAKKHTKNAANKIKTSTQ